MSDYVLEIRYGEDEDPARIELDGCSADDAEVARQAILHRIEHAMDIGAPVIYSHATDENPRAGVPVDPSRVTGVDLVAG